MFVNVKYILPLLELFADKQKAYEINRTLFVYHVILCFTALTR